MKANERKVFQLVKGDKLSSGALVVSSPSAGMNTPKGKMDIQIEYPNGETKWMRWGKHTVVTLEN